MKRPTRDFWRQISLLDQNLSNVTYYDLLGLQVGADSDALRSAYERQIRVVHPDCHAREDDMDRHKSLTRVYARIGEAYRVLSHPQLRADYDGGLPSGRLRHRQSRADTHWGAIADPRHPQAKSLFEQAQALIARNEIRAARSKLQLAKQYQPDSDAICDAIAYCDGKMTTNSGSSPGQNPAQAQSQVAALAAAAIEEAKVKAEAEAEAKAEARAKAKAEARAKAEAEAKAEADIAAMRAHARVPMGKSIQVTCDTLPQATSLYMQDISRGGMLLRCDEVLPLGSIIELGLKAPDGEIIELPAEVVRHIAPTKEGQRPAIGVRFLMIPQAIQTSFESLLRSAGIKSETPAEPVFRAPTCDRSAEEEALESTILEAQALIDHGAARDAIPMLQIAVHEYPDNDSLRSTFHLAAGLAARKMGLEVPARHHFERALRYDSDSTLVLRHLRDDNP